MLTGYLAPEGLEEPLQQELQHIKARYGRLFLTEGAPQKTHWAQNIWFDPQTLHFTSISHAAKQLRALHGLWAHYPYQEVRRGELISQQLPFFSPKPLPFPIQPPKGPLGSWTLIDENTLLAAPLCSSPFAHGELHFQETKIPPSRAYLKLWEALTRIGKTPQKGEKCLEIGASPGSWSWALQQLGAHVIAVDRAELDPAIAKLDHIQFMKRDAFALGPEDFPDLDWVFSDVICYPEKLLKWLERWVKTKVKLICTIKFQGTQDYAILREFQAMEGSQLMHLYHNKHELTWIRL